MKVAVCTIAYREEDLIERCIRQFEGILDMHLVLISEKPWHGSPEPLDMTGSIAESLGAYVITGSWVSEDVQRNFGQQFLADYDWILIVDADEYYSRKSIKDMLYFLKHSEFPAAYGIGKLYTYWKDRHHRIDPLETGGLIVAVKPSVRFTDKRCVQGSWGFLPENIVMHHYSYVRSDEGMKRKISTFEHQHEIVPNWYEEVWMKWNPEMENLHPVHPPSFKRSIPCE